MDVIDIKNRNKKKTQKSSIFSFFYDKEDDLLKEQRENNFIFMSDTAKFINSNGQIHKKISKEIKQSIKEVEPKF